MKTFGQQLSQHRGVGPGFDAVRLGLASAVLYVHRGLVVPGGTDPLAPLVPHLPVPSWAFDTLPVPLFFALSGFLVAASAERLPIGQFLLNRALRVFPALWLATFVSALVLGPLLTCLPLRDYVAEPQFRAYFLNLAALVRYDLPGLFPGNPEPGIVNGSLWTVPQELSCYVMLAGAVALGLLHRRFALLLATLALCLGSIGIALAVRYGLALPHRDLLVYVFVTRGAARLVPFFLSGVLAYLYRDRIPYGGAAAAAAALAVYFGICAFGGPAWIGDPAFTLLSAPLLAYAVVAAGLSPSLRLPASSAGDYSYGIYLYGFPLQQAIVTVWPGQVGLLPFMAVSALATGLAAHASWHLVEKPVLRLRRRFSLAARMHTEPLAEAAPVAQSGSRRSVATSSRRGNSVAPAALARAVQAFRPSGPSPAANRYPRQAASATDARDAA